MKWRIVAAVSAAVVLAMAAAAGLTAYQLLRPERLKARFERTVAARMHLEVAIGDLHLNRSAGLTLEGSNLELRVPGRPDLPAFVAMSHFVVDAPFWALIKGHVGTVRVDGLKITIPPGEDRSGLFGSKGSPAGRSKVIIEHLVAENAELTILRRAPGHRPLMFPIHELRMDGLGFERSIAFRARLTNPVPMGDVVSTGSVGPWQSTPADLPLEGDYRFSNANLDTIKGIGGTLTSTGRYSGTVSEITVSGTSQTPDFNLDMGGRPVPLTATFTAVVNGSNGTTHLAGVDATLLHTPIHLTGDIVNQPGPVGFDIKLEATITRGHIQDVLMLALDSGNAPITGEVSMKSAIVIPAGQGRVRDRMRLTGRFSLAKAVFADGQVQRKLVELSRRTQGKASNAEMAPVASAMGGAFTLAQRELDLPDLTFEVPGAQVQLTGGYSLPSGAIDFQGELRMQATVSQAVGGFKSVFVRPFDGLFKRDGAGAVLPIKISGTREQPKVGLRLGPSMLRGR